MKNVLVVIILLSITSCNDPFVPKGLYDYQVERLMTNDDSKLWTLQSLLVDGVNAEVMVCDTSIVFLANFVNADSLVFYEINKLADCSANDTIFWGAFEASVGFQNLFSDTLYFEGGDKSFGILREINPVFLSLQFKKNGVVDIYNLTSEN